MNDWIKELITPITIALISAAVPTALTFWLNSRTNKEIKENKKESKDNDAIQSKEIIKLNEKLNEKLLKEMEARKDFEKSIEIQVSKSWESLYHSERENSKRGEKRFEEMWEKYKKLLEESGKRENELELEIMNLREQLREKGVPDDEQNISDGRRKKEAVQEIETYWRIYSKNGKINGKTITEILWENWEKIFDNKEGDDIKREKYRLINLIIEASKLSK